MESIKLKEKEYELAYNMGAIKMLQKQIAPDNKNILDMAPIYKVLTKPNYSHICTILHVGIVGGGSKITEEEFTEIMDSIMPNDLNVIIIKVTSMFFKATMSEEGYEELLKNLQTPKVKKVNTKAKRKRK